MTRPLPYLLLLLLLLFAACPPAVGASFTGTGYSLGPPGLACHPLMCSSE